MNQETREKILRLFDETVHCNQVTSKSQHRRYHAILKDLLSEPPWTTTAPTKPGWYWMRADEKDDPYKDVVKVIEDNGDLYVEEDEWGAIITEYAGWEWAGPIEPPDAADENDGKSSRTEES